MKTESAMFIMENLQVNADNNKVKLPSVKGSLYF
jgi:hypothetical protein